MGGGGGLTPYCNCQHPTECPNALTPLPTGPHPIALGAFGVPSFWVRGQMLWGQDRVADIAPILDGRDPVTPEQIAALLAHTSSATRRRG